MIDLHIHSTASDGQYTPREIVEMAVQEGLAAIALTDHDTVDGLAEAAQAAQSVSMTFIPGIEFSVKGPQSVKELHILGYWIDPRCQKLLKMCQQFKGLREERAAKIFSYLEAQGIFLEKAAVEKLAGNGIIGRPHFARAMLEAGYISNIREAFDKYLATPDFERIERPKPAFEEGISAILAAGGIPVLAHPIQTKLPPERLEQLLVELIAAGLQGLECHYSTHGPEDTARYLGLARKYGLIVTGGSDFHGERIKPDIRLGSGINGSLHIEESPILLRGETNHVQ